MVGMIRCAFNGGELSPSAAVRADLDVYHRGCSRLVNFDVGQMGGIKRRRGFSEVMVAQEHSVLATYAYSNADSYVVEIGEMVRVIDRDGGIVASLDGVWGEDDLTGIRVRQVNSLLFIVCRNHPVMVLERGRDGVWDLREFEFKNMPWRYDEWREFPVMLVMDGGVWQLDFGEHEGESEAMAHVGELIRVRVTVASQTAYLTGAEIYEGYVFAPNNLTGVESYSVGDKLCVNRGNVWEWWTCIKAFKGGVDYVSGKDMWSDYPDYFTKGIVCHSQTVTSKGTWSFLCYKEWYGKYAVERRYPDTDWEVVGTSESVDGAPSNLELTGDEGDEECYLRLMLYESKLEDEADPKMGFIPDDCGNKLVADAYKKDVVLRLTEGAKPGTLDWVQTYGRDDLAQYFEKRSAVIRGNRVLVDGVEVEGAQATLSPGPDGRVDIKLKDVSAGSLNEGQAVTVEWNEPVRKVDVSGSSRDGVTEVFYLTVGMKVKVTGNDRFMNQVVDVSLYRDGEWVWKYTPPSAGPTYEYTVEQSGFYKIIAGRIQVDVGSCVGSVTVMADKVYKSEAVEGESGTWWVVQNEIKENIPTRHKVNLWSYPAFRAEYGYPGLVDVFQQRLVFASTAEQGQTIWMSRTDDLNNFEIDKDDDGAIAITFATTSQNGICWLMAQGSRLLVGTSNEEWIVSGGNNNALTPTNARGDIHGYVGSSNEPALMATDKVLYVERGGGRVYQYGYDYETDGFLSRDMTVFADHVLADGGGCVGGCFIRKPDPRAVMVLADGNLALMTYNAQHNVTAWYRYETAGRFKCVASVPNGNEADLLYAIVEREDGGHIEVMKPDNTYVDAGGRDYESVMVTNALCVPENGMGVKKQCAGVVVYLDEPAKVDGMMVSVDGWRWSKLDRAPSAYLTMGWHELIADGVWRHDSAVGIKVVGERGVSVMAIQG